MLLRDGYGRLHDNLRVSVTDRCNLRCAYCIPEEPEWFPHDQILSYEEMARVVRVVSAAGIRRVRITGGEPLVRRDVATFVALLASMSGLEDLSLTTNGVLLDSLAADLFAAGLRRLNVSLDTLDRARFKTLTGRDALDRVFRGLEAATAAGFSPVKINSVLLKDLNDGEVLDLVALGRDRGWEVRFIEYMPLENGGGWRPDLVVPGAAVRARIESRWPLDPDPDGDPHAPATRFLFRDGRGAVGFINSVTEPFCASCGRLRLTADGRIRACLHEHAEVDLKGAIRSGASDDHLARLVASAVAFKGRGGALDLLERPPEGRGRRTMHQIGG